MLSKINLAILFLFSCTTLTAQNAQVQPPSSAYNSAALKIGLGDFAGGCREARALTKTHPDFFGRFNLLGLCAVNDGDSRQAELNFRRSVQLNPNFISARINLAVNLVAKGDREEASKQLSQVLQQEPDNVTALYTLGRIELGNGAYDKAVSHLRRSQQLASNDGEIALALAEALIGSRQNSEASDLLKQVVGNEQNARVLFSSSLLLVENGDEAPAREGIERLLRLAPDIRQNLVELARASSSQQKFRAARLLLEVVEEPVKATAEWNALRGYADYKTGAPEKALERLRRAIQLDPNNEDYYMWIGELMLFHNSSSAAIAFFQAGLNRLPRSPLLHFGMAVSQAAEASNLQAARDHLETALQIRPDFQPALSLLCLIAMKQKDFGPLKNAANRLVLLSPDLHEGYYYKAVALVEGHAQTKPEKQTEEALQLLRKAIQLKPDFSDSHLALGKLLMRMGQIASATEEFSRASILDPENPESFYQLAMAYKRAGQREKSAAVMEEFKSLKAKVQQKEAAGWKVLFQVSK